MAGMTLVDSIDSILMLYSYTGFPERSWILFKSIKSDAPDLLVEKSDVESQREKSTKPEEAQGSDVLDSLQQLPAVADTDMSESPSVPEQLPGTIANTIPLDLDSRTATDTRVKMNVMSGISIILTLMSILVAFR
jgi:high-affinity nickel-transport protein